MSKGQTMSRRWAGGVLAAAASVTLVALPSSASAHSELAGTVPAVDGVTKGPVRSVSLVFASPIMADLTTVVVTGGGSSGVQVDGQVVEGSTVEASVEGAAKPGRYTVAYRTVSSDGHPITGSFSFAVAAPPENAPAARLRDDDAGSTTSPRGTAVSRAGSEAPDNRGQEGVAAGSAAEVRSSAGLQDVAPSRDVAGSSGSTDGGPGLGAIGVGAVLLVGAGALGRRLASRI